MKYKQEAYDFWGGKIPKRVRIIKSVFSDFPFCFRVPLTAWAGEEYAVRSNQNGAIFAVFKSGETLGLKPNEVEVIEWEERV